MEAWEAEQAAQKQAVIDTLSEQEQLTVRAMETAGFIFNPQAANPGLKENLVFTAGEYGYPITFENWEQAYLWIDGAELRDTPGLREQVQHILHPEPQNGVLTNEDYAAARGTLRERTSYDPAVPPYHVGDTVYLDDRPHQITELRDDTVQLLPTGMSYPIYRAESQERFEQLLREDNRNDFYTEFLPVNLDTVDQDLRDVLAHGLIGEADKAELSELLRNGKSNREIALWLSRTYPNIVKRWSWRPARPPITARCRKVSSWKCWMQMKSVWPCCSSSGARLRLCCAGCMPVSWTVLSRNAPNRLPKPRPSKPRLWLSIRAIRTICPMMWLFRPCEPMSRSRPRLLSSRKRLWMRYWTNTPFPFR